MKVLVDATTLIALGQIGELDLLTSVDGNVAIPEEVMSEVSTEPANANVADFISRSERATVQQQTPGPVSRAREILNEPDVNGDVQLVATVLSRTRTTEDSDSVGVVSDDRRVRTVADGLGATVTGTVGVIVRAVEERGMTVKEGKEIVRRVDSHGLHMTGELREKAYELIEDAAENE